MLDDQLTDIYLVGPNELWISTNSNKAYYSANGGQGWAVLGYRFYRIWKFFSYLQQLLLVMLGLVGYQGFIEHFAGPPPPPLNQPPIAVFNYNTNGLTVNFTDTSTDIDGSIVSWTWNFGDGIIFN